jgi:SulP family sulfate permease
LLGWSDPAVLGADAVSLVEKVPAALPAFHVPRIDVAWVSHLFSSAFAVGILGLLEALAIAKAIAQKSRQPLDYNRQCLAEGVGNLVGGFFQCIPGAGSLSRSAINYQAGAQSRWSGVVSALAVGVAVLLAAPLASQIPKAVLAGLLVVAASRLIDPVRLRYFLTASRYDATLTLVTGISALVAGIEFAILLGSGLSIVWYVLKAARIHGQELLVDEALHVRARTAEDSAPRGVLIHDLEGDLFFGAAPDLEHYLDSVLGEARAQKIQHVVVRLKRARNFDAVTLEVLEHFLKEAHGQGVVVLLAGMKPELLVAIQRMAITSDERAVRLYPQTTEEHSATLAAIHDAYQMAAEAHGAADRGDWPDVTRLAAGRYQV